MWSFCTSHCMVNNVSQMRSDWLSWKFTDIACQDFRTITEHMNERCLPACCRKIGLSDARARWINKGVFSTWLMKALKGFTYKIILLQCKLPMEELNKPTQFIFIQFILKDLPVFLLSHSNHTTFLFEETQQYYKLLLTVGGKGHTRKDHWRGKVLNNFFPATPFNGNQCSLST